MLVACRGFLRRMLNKYFLDKHRPQLEHHGNGFPDTVYYVQNVLLLLSAVGPIDTHQFDIITSSIEMTGW